MDRFLFERLSIPAVILIKPRVHRDGRGYFMEVYRENEFRKAGIDYRFVQENQSFSKEGVLRGLHFQKKPHEQGKLVRVAEGLIRDVAVDIRKDSPYFKRWVMVELKPGEMLWIPPGFAHGFYALKDSIVVYMTTDYYYPELDCGIRWNDPELAIDWGVDNPVLSEKDAHLPYLREVLDCLE